MSLTRPLPAPRPLPRPSGAQSSESPLLRNRPCFPAVRHLRRSRPETRCSVLTNMFYLILCRHCHCRTANNDHYDFVYLSWKQGIN